jgi:hypothetical protein
LLTLFVPRKLRLHSALNPTVLIVLDRRTFYAFGSDSYGGGCLSKYGLNDSIRDGATKELHFEPRLVNLHID